MSYKEQRFAKISTYAKRNITSDAEIERFDKTVGITKLAPTDSTGMTMMFNGSYCGRDAKQRAQHKKIKRSLLDILKHRLLSLDVVSRDVFTSVRTLQAYIHVLENDGWNIDRVYEGDTLIGYRLNEGALKNPDNVNYQGLETS